MKPGYLNPESNHRDRWMVSYLDAVTILLIFFIAIARMVHPPAHAEPTVPKPPAVRLIDARKPVLDKIEQRLRTDGLEAHRESRGLMIHLPQTILFASGEDRLSESAFPVIEKVAETLREIPNPVILAGHADSVPIHTRRFKNNWELSAARGLRLLEVLHSRYGIDEARMSIASDGSNGPAQSNQTPAGRANNRRVDILILDEPASHSGAN
jgi:chemotaxis protein MotB